MIRTFFRHWLESLKSLKRNGLMTFASISAVTITLVLVGLFLGVILNVRNLANDIENDVNVNVFVAIGTSQKDMDALKEKLVAIPNVEKVDFSSKDDQYKKFLKVMGKDWELVKGDENPLYDVYVLSTQARGSKNKQTIIKEVADAAKQLEFVQKVDYGGLQADKLLSFSNSVQLWGGVAAVLLLIVAILLINNTIRITILSRQREIQIMRLVGAKNGFIRWPFFLEGAWIGLLGAIVPITIIFLGYPKVYNLVNPQLIKSGYSLLKVHPFVPQLSLLLVVVGCVIGSLGSVISIRRFLKA